MSGPPSSLCPWPSAFVPSLSGGPQWLARQTGQSSLARHSPEGTETVSRADAAWHQRRTWLPEAKWHLRRAELLIWPAGTIYTSEVPEWDARAPSPSSCIEIVFPELKEETVTNSP